MSLCPFGLIQKGHAKLAFFKAKCAKLAPDSNSLYSSNSNRTPSKAKCNSISATIDTLWSLLPQEVKDKAAANKGTAPVIDVTQFGYFKVLSKGVLPTGQPVIVKAKLVSKNTEKKIKENVGVVVLTT